MTKNITQLKLKTILLLLTLILNFSVACVSKDSIIYYNYDGVTITRIDRDGETYFYYGGCNNQQVDCKKPIVKAKYSGLNSGLDGLLNFKPNGFVEVISLGGGYFTKEEGMNDKLLINHSENSTKISNTLDSLKKSGSVIHFNNNIELEKELNRKSKSKVNATYKNNTK